MRLILPDRRGRQLPDRRGHRGVDPIDPFDQRQRPHLAFQVPLQVGGDQAGGVAAGGGGGEVVGESSEDFAVVGS